MKKSEWSDAISFYYLPFKVSISSLMLSFIITNLENEHPKALLNMSCRMLPLPFNLRQCKQGGEFENINTINTKSIVNNNQEFLN